MEYAEEGDLYSLIKQYKKNNRTFPEEELWKFTYDILAGVDYLHTNKIIHRDMKCLNLFMTKDRRIKIGDLGVSKIVSSMDALQITRVGTPLYLSPEQIKQVPYDCKVDMWSVGCSLYHLACLDPPFKGENLIILGTNILKCKPKPVSTVYSKNFCDLIEKLLSKKSENRPTAINALTSVPKHIVKEMQQDNLVTLLKGSQQNFHEDRLVEVNLNKNTIRPSTSVDDSRLNNILKEVNHSQAYEVKKENIIRLEAMNNVLSIPSKELKRESNPVNIGNIGIMTPSNNTNNNVNIFLKQNKLNILKTSLIRKKEGITTRVVNNFKMPINNITKDYNPIQKSDEIVMLEKLENLPNNNKFKTSENKTPRTSTKELKDIRIQVPSLLNIAENHKQIVETNSNEIDNLQLIENLKNEEILGLAEIEEDLEFNDENCKVVDKKLFLNKHQKINKSNEEVNFINKRLLSAKLRTQKFRPNTASNNKILNGYYLDETKDNSQKLNQRPSTAINRTEDKPPLNGGQISTSENNNVINININFYNVDMNRRYINPAVQSSLIQINKSLFPIDKKDKPIQTEFSKERRRNKSTNPPLTTRDNINTNSSQLVFHKIMRSIESQLR